MTLANEIVPVNALEFEAVIILSYDKVFGLFFFLAIVLVIVYNLGKRAGRQEVRDLLGPNVEMIDAVAQEPATPRTRSRTDCRRYTAAEIDLLYGKGYNILSDQSHERLRQFFLDALPPSIEDVMPQEEIDRMLRGEPTTLEVPLDPSRWDGISREDREERVAIWEDSVLLNIPYEEMDDDWRYEAQALRAELATAREREEQAAHGEGVLRVVMSSLPELPAGTMVSVSSGSGSSH